MTRKTDRDPDPPSLATTVRRMREARGWTQRELAARAGVTGQVLSNVERGKSRGSVALVEALARAFGEPIKIGS